MEAEDDIFVSKIKKLELDNKKLTDEIYYLHREVFDLDCRLIECEQYSRRENIVISGIPNSIPQNQLENKVLDILNTIDCKVTSYDIAAVHRIGGKKSSKYPTNTIVRFVNRRAAIFCIENRDRLLECRKVLKMNLRF